MTLDELKQQEQEEQRRLRALREKIRQKEKAEREARWQALGKVVEEILGRACTPESLRAALTGGYQNGASHSMERPISSSPDIDGDVESAAVSESSDHLPMEQAEPLMREDQRSGRGMWGRRQG